jgi:hypothetical protein
MRSEQHRKTTPLLQSGGSPCIQILSTYKKRKYHHEFLSGREVQLLREIVNALRVELGWLPQDPKTEREKDKLEEIKEKLAKSAPVGDSR